MQASTFKGIVASIVLGGLVATTTAARAGSAEPPADGAARGSEGAPPASAGATDAHPRRVLALTVSPFHALERILELMAEYRVGDKVGVALLAGIGQYEGDGPRNLTAAVYEAGAQVRYYVVGDFRHGMELGAQLAYVHVASEEVLSTAEGVGIGPFAGYKLITDLGFTLDGQLGVQYLASHVTSKSGVAPGPETSSRFAPIFRVNVGWSF